MKITVTGSLGNISRILTEKLVDSGHDVSVISSRQETAAAINAIGAKALIGRLDDEQFIRNAFTDAEAVYTMVPPSYGTAGEIKKVGSVYVRAVRENKVPYVVNLSGIGAHLQAGPGPAGANWHNEKKFNAHVLHLRPGLFYSNFYGAADMMRYQHIIGNNFDENTRLALSHPHDIAQVAFEAIDDLNFSGKNSLYVVSAVTTGKEIASTLGRAVNMEDLNWVEFSDQELFENLLKQGMPAEMAKTYIVDMGIALRNGTLLEVYFKESNSILAKATSFEKFAQEFAEILI